MKNRVFILLILTFIGLVRIDFAQSEKEFESAKIAAERAGGFQWLATVELIQAEYYSGNNPKPQTKINNIIGKITAELRKTPKVAPFLSARSYAYYAIAEVFNHQSAFGKNKLNDSKIKANLALANKDIEKAIILDKSLPDFFRIRGKIRVFQCAVKVFSSEKDCYEKPLNDFDNAIGSAPDSYYFFDDRIELNKSFGKTDLIKPDEELRAIYEPLTTKKIETEEKLEAKQTAENYYEAAKASFDLYLSLTGKKELSDKITVYELVYSLIEHRNSFLGQSIENISQALKLSKKAEYFALRGKANLYAGSIYDNEKEKETAVKYYESAIEDYTEAIRLDPNNTDFYVRRAVTYGYLGREDLKKADVETARKLKSKQ